MLTQLVSTAIPIPDSSHQIQAHVMVALAQYGQPLRWSITKVQFGLLHLEAIVTCGEPP